MKRPATTFCRRALIIVTYLPSLLVAGILGMLEGITESHRSHASLWKHAEQDGDQW